MREIDTEYILIKYLLDNNNLEKLSEIQDTLNIDEKIYMIKNVKDLKSIEFVLSNFRILTTEDRKELIEKADNLYSLLCDMKGKLNRDEISNIINILINQKDFKNMENIMKNLNHLLFEDDIDNIVTFYLNSNNDVWDLVDLIKTLKFQLSEKNISEIVNKISEKNCIKSLICILKDFNNILCHDDIINIINVIFEIDSNEAYIPEVISLINFELLSDDDVMSIIVKICSLKNESCISDSIINIANNLSSKQSNYLVHKLDEKYKLNKRICNILLTMYVCKLNRVSISIIVKSVCKIGNDKDIIFISKQLKGVIDNDDITEIINAICKEKVPCSILETSRILKDYLRSDSIKLCANTLCKIRNIEFLYKFLLEFNDKLDEKTKLQIKQVILQSMEYKYIILLAVLIDIALISMLFERVDDLYIFIVTSGLFTVEEISLIKEKLNIKNVEPNVDKAVKSLKNIKKEIK